MIHACLWRQKMHDDALFHRIVIAGNPSSTLAAGNRRNLRNGSFSNGRPRVSGQLSPLCSKHVKNPAQQNVAVLFDQLIGTGEQGLGHRQAERLHI